MAATSGRDERAGRRRDAVTDARRPVLRWRDMRRRSFLYSLSAAALACGGPAPEASVEEAAGPGVQPLTRSDVAFITDEVSPDLDEAIAFAKEFELEQVEIRGLWGEYGILLSPERLREARAKLDDAGLRVCSLSTPILKCIAPGFEPIERVRLDIKNAQNTFPVPDDEQYGRQLEFTKRAIEACGILGTDNFRIFSFWRTADPASAYPLLREKIAELAEPAAAAGLRLGMENEHACNVADCAEAMAALAGTPANVGILWDVLNGVSTGEQPYPDGYAKLDKARLFHVQLKDADLSQGTERFRYTAVGDGDMPYVDVFRALAADGYSGAVSMETHFQLNGSRQEASRASMRGVLAAIKEASS